ncbi:hypothetical protein V8C37DRAFT_43593 [Trichoderma ceciliae]
MHCFLTAPKSCLMVLTQMVSRFYLWLFIFQPIQSKLVGKQTPLAVARRACFRQLRKAHSKPALTQAYLSLDIRPGIVCIVRTLLIVKSGTASRFCLLSESWKASAADACSYPITICGSGPTDQAACLSLHVNTE